MLKTDLDFYQKCILNQNVSKHKINNTISARTSKNTHTNLMKRCFWHLNDNLLKIGKFDLKIV